MLLVDTRRLTGPNLLARAPLVIVELTLEAGERLDVCLAAYRAELARMRAAHGLSPEIEPIVFAHAKGAVIGYEAPIDVMLAHAEMSEWAALSAIEVLASREPLSVEPKQAEVSGLLARDASEAMLELAREAKQRGIPFLWDDGEVTLGLGCRSLTHARDSLPTMDDMTWGAVGRIPVAMVSGTNGKTTSSRLLARIATEAGFVVGCTSSDGITIGGATVELGDWTGPGAARTVLRHREVELAVLETARGGILRRGLGLESCDVALITNISDDHLGLYGVDDTSVMTQVKGVIAQAVSRDGTVVLNACDSHLVLLAETLSTPITFFADLERGDAAGAEVIARHQRQGGRCVFTRAGQIVCSEGASELVLTPVAAVPLTFGGQARYNIENVLGVVAAARGLGLEPKAIDQGLRAFAPADNPGRGQLVEKNGVRVMLDFGHNPEGVRAVLSLVSELRKGKPGALTVIAAVAGDRSDQEIEDVAHAILEAKPNRILLRELADYMRGRAPGEVPNALRKVFRDHQFPDGSVSMAESEVEALERAFERAQAGDFIVVLVHLEQAEVGTFLSAR